MLKHSKTKTTKPLTINTIELFLAQEREATKDRPKITNKEKLIWLFQTLIKEGLRDEEDLLMVPFDKLLVAPYFYKEKHDDVYQDFYILIRPIQTDKDFFRKHNMLNYKPEFTFDESKEYSEHGVVFFKDFTDDFLKEYLEDRLGVKYSNKSKSDNKSIKKIEVLKDETERGRVRIYINGNYKDEPMNLSRNNRWGLIYKLAKKEEVPFNKNLYDYFNYQQTNPLYTKGFQVTKILKEEDGYIVPNIQIKLITKNKTTRQLKSA